MQPEIINQNAHEMSWKEMDFLREQLCKGSVSLDINQNQMFLYLNQMEKWISFILKRTQEIQMLTIPAGIVFLFISWKVSVALFIYFVMSTFFLGRLANACIYYQCKKDRAFLKFALTVGLAKLKMK